jgi:hypothetical protein
MTNPDIQAMLAAEDDAERRRQALEATGTEAMQCLANAAQGDSGQSHHCRRILLVTYNGNEWPLDLTRLRVIDRKLQRAAIAAIELGIYAGDAPWRLLPDGERLMQQFAAMETNGEVTDGR